MTGKQNKILTWQPDPGQGPNDIPPKHGCHKVPCSKACKCPTEHKIKIYEDSGDPTNWHVERKDCGSNGWSSKNGFGSLYTNISDPDAFYQSHYPPKGKVIDTCWCCKNKP
jgi:hypothetical protein